VRKAVIIKDKWVGLFNSRASLEERSRL